MRIAQVANLVHPASGGIRTVLDRLADGYAGAGHEVHLISPGPTATVVGRTGGAWHQLLGPRLPGSGDYRVLLRRAPVQRLLEELQVDVVELSDRWSLAWVGSWARARGLPITLLAHERLDRTIAAWLPRPAHAMAPRLASWLDRRQDVDAVVAPSSYVAQGLADIGPVHQLSWGTDLEVFHPGAGAPPPGRAVADRPLRLVLVSRLSSEKRPELALQTTMSLVARGVQVELHVAGDGPLRPLLSDHAHGAPVTLLGHLGAPADVARLLASADVALVVCGIEGFGLAALEALACGTPVVATTEGAAAELLDPDEHGRRPGAVADPSPDAIAAAVLEVVRTPGVRVDARTRALARGWAPTVERLLALHGTPRSTAAAAQP